MFRKCKEKIVNTDCEKEVAAKVADALEEERLKNSYLEWAKQFPKVTTTEVTQGPGNTPAWLVGDWVAVNGVVYEITGAVCIATESPNPTYFSGFFYGPIPAKDRYAQKSYIAIAYKFKLRTIPLKGQPAIEGWAALENKTVFFLNRTNPGVELTKDA